MSKTIENIDLAILPLLNSIWKLGINTYQSCSGHKDAEGFPTAHLWLDNSSMDDNQIDTLSRKPGIEQISRIWGRESFPVIEILFAGEASPLFAVASESILEVLKNE